MDNTLNDFVLELQKYKKNDEAIVFYRSKKVKGQFKHKITFMISHGINAYILTLDMSIILLTIA